MTAQVTKSLCVSVDAQAEIRGIYLNCDNSHGGKGTGRCAVDSTIKSTFTKESEESSTYKTNRRDRFRPVVVKAHGHLTTQHGYHDHASDPKVVSSPSPRAKGNQSRSSYNGTITPFPMKLFEMIQQMDTDGLAHIVSWQPHGRCFQVHQPSTFQKLLHNYFKLSKIASFQRQLNLYDFQRLTVGSDKGSYNHEFFLRNRPDLLPQVRRIKVKGTGIRAKANPQDEPYLYLYPDIEQYRNAGVYTAQAASLSNTQKTSMNSSEKLTSGVAFISSDIPTANYISSLDYDNDITMLMQEQDDDFIVGFDASESMEVSLDNYQPTSVTRHSHIRNLSFMNMPTPVQVVTSLSTFPKYTNITNTTLQQHGILRNVSSCILENNTSFTSNTSRGGASDGFGNALEQDKNTICGNNLDSSDKKATMAIEALLLPCNHDTEISFEKLMDEMFHLNQKGD
jgi:HSF-type DNA-binding